MIFVRFVYVVLISRLKDWTYSYTIIFILIVQEFTQTYSNMTRDRTKQFENKRKQFCNPNIICGSQCWKNGYPRYDPRVNSRHNVEVDYTNMTANIVNYLNDSGTIRGEIDRTFGAQNELKDIEQLVGEERGLMERINSQWDNFGTLMTTRDGRKLSNDEFESKDSVTKRIRLFQLRMLENRLLEKSYLTKDSVGAGNLDINRLKEVLCELKFPGDDCCKQFPMNPGYACEHREGLASQEEKMASLKKDIEKQGSIIKNIKLSVKNTKCYSFQFEKLMVISLEKQFETKMRMLKILVSIMFVLILIVAIISTYIYFQKTPQK